ncbi:MAG: anaerobic glycerol-3-phosphate dehydrogenase subunit GlpC [Prevotella sp.]|jgi:glycerol-3-phosphate dehydrogenase subunit C
MEQPTQTHTLSPFNFEQCLKCSICTVYCPVSAVEPNYPGPKQSGPDNERYRLKHPDFFNESLKLCLNCKRCEVACPEHVNVGDIIQMARIKYSTHKPSLRDRMLANTDFVGTLAHTFAPITNFALGLKPMKAMLDGVMKIDKHRQFPAYAFQTFEQWYRKHAEEQEAYSKHVSYFHGCYANYNFPKLSQDLVKVLNACGYGVRLLEKEKCCGVALIANGMPDQARRQGEVNINSMRKAVERSEDIVTSSSTCTFTMRDEYPHLLKIDNHDVRPHLGLATRWLYQKIEKGEIRLAFRKDFKAHAAYHEACHMERMGWGVYSIEMMRMIPGLKLTVLDSNCCGIAGTYGFKKENYERSQAIGAPLFRQIKEVNPDYVACDCETCKWQIEMSTGYSVLNPVSILADALDVEATRQLNNVK